MSEGCVVRYNFCPFTECILGEITASSPGALVFLYSSVKEYYTEGSLDEKSVTRIGSCQGVNASMHLLRNLSQQVHRGIHPPDNLKRL